MHSHDDRYRVLMALGTKGYDSACNSMREDMAGVTGSDLENRVRFGAAAVLAGTPDFGLNDDATDCVDALTNLLHYAEDIGADVVNVLRLAVEHFEHEQQHGCEA